eukprot:1392809-Pyramimonas_sp.AAC.1
MSPLKTETNSIRSSCPALVLFPFGPHGGGGTSALVATAGCASKYTRRVPYDCGAHCLRCSVVLQQCRKCYQLPGPDIRQGPEGSPHWREPCLEVRSHVGSWADGPRIAPPGAIGAADAVPKSAASSSGGTRRGAGCWSWKLRRRWSGWASRT